MSAVRQLASAAALGALVLSVACLSASLAEREAAPRDELAMSSPGPGGAFQFQVPALPVGSHFVVDLPSGLGSQIVQVAPGMQPGEAVQMQIPLQGAARPAPRPNMLAQPQAVESSLPALAPLDDFPYAHAEQQSVAMPEWRNQASPVKNDDASALALLKWRPAKAWAKEQASQERLEESVIARKAQPKLWQEVHELKHELADARSARKAEAQDKRHLKAQAKLLEAKLAVEKKRLLHSWRQGEKELGGREEAEGQAQRLRREASENEAAIVQLRAEVKSRNDDVRAFKGELLQSKVAAAESADAESEKMHAEMRGDEAEIVDFKNALAADKTALAKNRDEAAMLAKAKQELRARENAMLQMERKDGVQEKQLEAAKNAVVRMVFMKGDSVGRQAAVMLKKEEEEEQADRAEVGKLKEQLSNAAKLQTASKGANAELAEEEEHLQEEKGEVQRLKTKYRKAAQEAAGSEALAKEVKSLTEQVAHVKSALSSVVDSSEPQHDQNSEEEGEIAEAERAMTHKVTQLKKQLSERDKELADAREKAGSAQMLQKEVDKDDASMRKAC
jgi:chromosome segregation ATPase